MLCRAGARSGQGEAGVETASVEGSSRGGWKGGVESPPHRRDHLCHCLGVRRKGWGWKCEGVYRCGGRSRDTVLSQILSEFSVRWERGPSGGLGVGMGQRRAVGEAGELTKGEEQAGRSWRTGHSRLRQRQGSG